MSDVFYDNFLKIFRCSPVPLLQAQDFKSHYNHELKTVFSKAFVDIFKEDRGIIGSSSFLADVDWQQLRDAARVSFKQERVQRNQGNEEYLLSYLMVKFPREFGIKRQYFVIVQTMSAKQNRDTGVSTMLIVRTSVGKFLRFFLKWCRRSLAKEPVDIVPMKFDTVFVKSVYNALHATRANTIGDIAIEFAVKTDLGALNSIKIDVPSETVRKVSNLVQTQADPASSATKEPTQTKEASEFISTLFSQLSSSTGIAFDDLHISKISTNCMSMNCDTGRVYFSNGDDGLRLSGDKMSVYEVIFAIKNGSM